MKQRISGAVGSVGEEDRQRIAAALDAVFSSLGPLDNEICHELEDEFRYFTLVQTKSGVGLGETRNQLAALLNSITKMQKHLNAIYFNDSIRPYFWTCGVDLRDFRLKLRELEDAVWTIEVELPTSSRWPKQSNPLHKLISRLAFLYEEITGETAKSGIMHNRDTEEYYGRFFELVMAVFKGLGISLHSNPALGKQIVLSLTPRGKRTAKNPNSNSR